MTDRRRDTDDPDGIRPADRAQPAREHEPPVVARLVVEVRSDGTHTIARGAMEDAASGQQVAIEARGSSPAQLAWALAKNMFRAPSLARRTARALIRKK